MESQRPFYTRIESLRGIGALAVAAYHFSGVAVNGVPLFPYAPWPNAGPLQNALGRLGMALMPGHGALMMFFVISGFVLSVSLRHGPQAPGQLALAFHIARIARIWPVVAFSVVVGLALNGWQAFGPPPGPIDVHGVIRNILLLDVSMNGVLWALQLEAAVAPLIALLFLIERRWGVGVLVAVAVVATPLSFSPNWAGWSPLSRNLFAFVLGMLIPTLGRDFASALSRTAAGRCAILAVAGLVLPRTLFGMFSAWSAVVEAYAAVVLVSLVAYRTDLRGFGILDAWLWRRLGLASGSYYALHLPLMIFIAGPTAALIPAAWSHAAPAAVGWLVVLLWLAVVFPVALCSYHLVEAPGMALGRRVRRWLVGPARAAPRTGGASGPLA